MSRRKLRTRADGERVTFRTFAEPGLFLLPFLIGLLVFTVYPFINVITAVVPAGLQPDDRRILRHRPRKLRRNFP